MTRPARLWRLAQGARLATYLMALWRLSRHPGAPRGARWVGLAVLAYAVSPVDLIPDFIPVLGLIDDVLLIPAGVALVVRMTPDAVWQDCMAAAREQSEALPRLWWGAVFIVLVWLVMLGCFVWWLVSTVVGGA
jgi:uncharacterized membrane protein YkvA (DUF1232 family)